MNSGLHGQVKSPKAICCQEYYSREVLELFEKHSNEGIAVSVAGVFIPRFQENIGFVQEDDGLPYGGILEDFFEFLLKYPRALTIVSWQLGLQSPQAVYLHVLLVEVTQ